MINKMEIQQAIANISLLMTLPIGLVNAEYAKASDNLAQCFNNQTKFKTLAHYEMKQSEYYLVDIFNGQINSTLNVIQINSDGNCSRVVEQEQLLFYPLSNFLSKEIAYNLLTSKYLTLIEQVGSVDSFKNGLLGELDADSPHVFFEEDVIVLKRLGIDLEEETPNLVIVGEEGIPGHPDLQFKE